MAKSGSASRQHSAAVDDVHEAEENEGVEEVRDPHGVAHGEMGADVSAKRENEEEERRRQGPEAQSSREQGEADGPECEEQERVHHDERPDLQDAEKDDLGRPSHLGQAPGSAACGWVG